MKWRKNRELFSKEKKQLENLPNRKSNIERIVKFKRIYRERIYKESRKRIWSIVEEVVP